MELFLAYTYCIRNKETGEFYFGSRSANIRKKRHPHEDLGVHYTSSSRILNEKVKSAGIDAFEWIILKTDSDPDACYWYENDLIRENIKNPLCLNRHYVDRHDGVSFCMRGVSKSPEHRAKIGEAQKGRPRSKQERANLSRGQKSKAPPSAETREKLSLAGKNRDYSLEPERNAKISKALKGRTRDEDTVKKMSESRKGKPAHENTANTLRSKIRCPHCGVESTLGTMKRWHFDACRTIKNR